MYKRQVLNGDGDSWVIGCLLAGEDSNDIENADIEKVRASLNELKGQLLGELEHALDNHEFCFFLQPKCNSITRAIEMCIRDRR